MVTWSPKVAGRGRENRPGVRKTIWAITSRRDGSPRLSRARARAREFARLIANNDESSPRVTPVKFTIDNAARCDTRDYEIDFGRAVNAEKVSFANWRLRLAGNNYQ